jgi:hypothetical protein
VASYTGLSGNPIEMVDPTGRDAIKLTMSIFVIRFEDGSVRVWVKEFDLHYRVQRKYGYLWKTKKEPQNWHRLGRVSMHRYSVGHGQDSATGGVVHIGGWVLPVAWIIEAAHGKPAYRIHEGVDEERWVDVAKHTSRRLAHGVLDHGKNTWGRWHGVENPDSMARRHRDARPTPSSVLRGLYQQQTVEYADTLAQSLKFAWVGAIIGLGGVAGAVLQAALSGKDLAVAAYEKWQNRDNWRDLGTTWEETRSVLEGHMGLKGTDSAQAQEMAEELGAVEAKEYKGESVILDKWVR